jgi:hypothetical protein
MKVKWPGRSDLVVREFARVRVTDELKGRRLSGSSWNFETAIV